MLTDPFLAATWLAAGAFFWLASTAAALALVDWADRHQRACRTAHQAARLAARPRPRPVASLVSTHMKDLSR